MQDSKSFSFVAEVVGDTQQFMEMSNEGHFPMLVVRDNVLFPGIVMPMHIARPISIKTLKTAERKDLLVAIFTQKDAASEHPEQAEILPVGVVAKLVHFMQMPDGAYSALFQAMNRVRLTGMQQTRNGLECDVTNKPEGWPDEVQKPEFATMLGMVKERAKRLGEMIDEFPREMVHYIEQMEPNAFMLNFISANVPIDTHTKHGLLIQSTLMSRGLALLKVLNNLIALTGLKKRVEQKTQSDLNQQQREYFINQEIRNLQTELGKPDECTVKDEDMEELSRKAAEKKWDFDTLRIFERELSKLNRINVQSPDYNVQLNYLQTFVELPWGEFTPENINLEKAERRLNKDHYGMEVVKERILEHLAVLKLRNDRKSPILCLYGPPGVGKTSLGKSIAEALGRRYVRISLGGVHDESEIRGHRRTYIGAMPGRIIKGIQRACSANPVFILDEIDKVAAGGPHGDPSSALLEVLDPEQNAAFHDNFLDVDFDLSNVMFIATANDVSAIPSALLDRMELIEVSGYLTEEKIEIAKRHLVPKKKESNGLAKRKDIKVNKAALEFMIERYTRESGVRALEKQVDKLFRKVALNIAKEDTNSKINITPAEVEQYLGKPRFSRDQYQGNDFAGVVTGLAWTSVGGEILFIETSVSRSKAPHLTLTGNLGDVMKESAMLALEYIRSHASEWDIDPRVFEQYSLHIHVPEGAVPKDGPSAGVTMATSIASALTQRKVRKNLAMTGEITLRGKVLPVGGIKEKILAAKRAGITDLMLCHENRKDIEEIPEEYVKGLHFHYVHTISDVLSYALLEEKVMGALEFPIESSLNESDK